MQLHLPCLVALALGALPGAWGQSVDPLSRFVSQAFSVYTGVVSVLSVQATATNAARTTSSSSSSTSSSTTSSTSSSTSSTRSSTFSTSIQASTPTISPSNTAEAAAASSSAAAAVAAMNSQNNKNRTIAIVLGVVLGLLALALLVGIVLFCLRRRRRRRAVGSRRSVSPEAMGGASWGKEPLTTANNVEHTTSSRFSTNERHPASIGAAAPLMAENTQHNYGPHNGIGSHAPMLHRTAPNFQPGMMERPAAEQALHRPSPNHIPLSSHSRSNAAAAGLGGAALGGLAEKHHHDKQDERDSRHHPNDDRRTISRKPVGGVIDHRPTDGSLNMGLSNDSVPSYRSRSGSLPASSANTNGNPPAYNGTSHALSSHPPFEDSNRKGSGHEPLMAGAAGAGAGTVVGAALAEHHDRDPEPNSALTGRRSWDANRQPRNPQSILANASNRRSTGSTNPYVQPRSPGRRARFSDDVASSDSPVRGENFHHDELPQHSPQQIRPASGEHTRNGSPRTNMPGGWHGSPDHDQLSQRGSFSNDTTISSPQAVANPSLNPKGPSLSDLRRQEEDGWYRGRYMGDDVRPVPVDPGNNAGNDQRFYANRVGGGGVGQAM